MHLGVNCLAEIPTFLHPSPVDIDKAVYQIVKLVGHVRMPEYAHGVQTFPDYLEMKASDPQFPNSAYYKTTVNAKLDRNNWW